MVALNITYNDAAKAAALPLLAPTIQAAVAYLDGLLVLRGTLDVAVEFETTSTGRFGGTGDTAFVGNFGGFNVWEASALAESRGGIDPHPAIADITISIDPTSNYVAGLWWDPAIATNLSANPPNDKTDAFSVVVHELLHGLGVVGWRNRESGALPADYESRWDSLLTIDNGRAQFAGPATVDLLGGPVEVMLGGSQGVYHLGNGPTVASSNQPWVLSSNLNGYFFRLGERYTLGRLELALLQDLGYSLKPNTITDVVNLWDDTINTLYRVGYAGADVLTGSLGNDRLEGRDGDDRLSGSGGNDQLLGGSGVDTAIYAGLRSRYTLSGTGADRNVVDLQSGGDGSDSLSSIERLQFSDVRLALDLDGRAGQVAKLLGAVFGTAAVANRAYVGIGLAQLDGGSSYEALAALAMSVTGKSTPADVVALLWGNVVGSAPSAQQAQPYIDMLNGGMSIGQLTVLAADTSINTSNINLTGLATSGLEYT